jgi:hypothetical protein
MVSELEESRGSRRVSLTEDSVGPRQRGQEWPDNAGGPHLSLSLFLDPAENYDAPCYIDVRDDHFELVFIY